MELLRADLQYNKLVGKFNGLLHRYWALEAENARLRLELAEVTADRLEWRRAAYRARRTAG